MIEDELKKKYVLVLPGRDYEGHRIVYLTNFKKSKEIENVHLYIFNKVCKEIEESPLEPYTFTVLIDITRSVTVDIYSFKGLSVLLKNNFKDRLHKLYIFPCGILERIAFTGIRHFMGKNTVQKIILVSKNQKLIQFFDKEILPQHLGGTSKINLI